MNVSTGRFFGEGEGLRHADGLAAPGLDYDVPFIPVALVLSPICVGAVDVRAAAPGALPPGGGPPTAPRP